MTKRIRSRFGMLTNRRHLHHGADYRGRKHGETRHERRRNREVLRSGYWLEEAD
ncbi:MAG: hypothetical protein AAGK14_15490 [Verrucomicrobiota bacterium]